MRSVIHLAITTVLAACMATNEGCKPPTKADQDKLYAAELAACVAKATTLGESCSCRKDVDTRWGVCERWPGSGRCATDCSKVGK